jgi:hypothetical protein
VTLPFSHDAFLDVFAIYNRAWWPVAVILWLVTVAAVIQLTRGHARGAGLAAILAVHWAWAGVAYHWLAFTTINPAAPVFAGAFLLQALAFVWTGVVGHRLAFAWGRAPRHWVAAGLLLMALAYPVLAQLTVGVGPRARRRLACRAPRPCSPWAASSRPCRPFPGGCSSSPYCGR